MRQFRGRLATAVTIVTAGDEDGAAGLTVSSLLVVEGEPSAIHIVLSPMADLWDVIARTSRFVVHVCDDRDRSLAEIFAGQRPNPGGPFSGVATTDSDWGPVLADVADRAFCSLASIEATGYSGLVIAQIDRIETSDMDRPLLYFRGRYRTVEA